MSATTAEENHEEINEETGEEACCEKKFFDEREEVLSLIQYMVETPFEKMDPLYMTKFERFNIILDRYLEQSQLLDPFLSEMVNPIMSEVKRVVHQVANERNQAREEAHKNGSVAFPFQVYKNPKLHKLFQLIYQLCKVRGYKTIVKTLPHEVCDFEPTVMMLQSQDRDDYSTWETRYVLLLWLSMLCFVPFDLTSIDSSMDNTGSNISIVSNILTLCKSYLSDPGATQLAASLCLSRLLSRPDMEEHYQKMFLNWANEELMTAFSSEDLRVNQFKVTGIVLSLAHLSKNSPREQHFQMSKIYYKSVMQLINKLAEEDACSDRPSSSTLHRKLSVKLVQRLGLLYLPPRVMSWRYKRGLRSLELNMQLLGLTSASDDTNKKSEKEEEEKEEETTFEVMEELEEIVEVLLCGLRDKDTVVRWSAAKGIGRITGRLPYEYADDIVQSVLELFVASEGDGAWHGASLALAELARRGVLLPQRLPEAVPCVTRALQYDIRRGAHSIGSHVRDAACYSCWSFARAYEPNLLLPYLVETLAPAMLMTCVFDRELNCRRAASAAFQENVGRQGRVNFPHGIDLLTRADYFSVANLRHAYLDVSVFIAGYPQYRYPLLDIVVNVKLLHWDIQIRTLAASAFAKIAALDPEYVMQHLMRTLLQRAIDPDVEVIARHGALLTIAEVLITLSQKPVFIDAELQKEFKNVVLEVEKKRLFRGRGGEMVRTAVCSVIKSITMSGISLTLAFIKKYITILEDCFVHPTESVREGAIEAFQLFGQQYFPRIFEKAPPAQLVFLKEMVPRFLNAGVLTTLKDRDNTIVLNPNVAARRGYIRAIGVSCNPLLEPSVRECVNVLRRAATLDGQTSDEQDAESRVAAIKALVDICCRTELPKNSPWVQGIEQDIVLTLVKCIENDYGVDERGDVGSWIRKEAMLALEKLLVFEETFKKTQLVGKQVKTKYGNGVIARVVGELGICSQVSQADPLCLVQFAKPSFGFYYFPQKGQGYIHLSQLQLVSYTNMSVATGGETFTVPGHEERTNFMTKSSQETSQRASKLFDFPTHLVAPFVYALTKQLSEKLDGMRQVAGQILMRILHSKTPRIDGIPDRGFLETEVFPESLVATINWSAAHETFPLVVKLMNAPSYLEAVMSGLIISVGGLTESVVKSSKAALFEWVQGHIDKSNMALLSRFGFFLTQLLALHSQEDRVIIPLLKTIAMLLESNLLQFFLNTKTKAAGVESDKKEPGEEFAERLYEGVRDIIQKTTDPLKLTAGISVFVGFLPTKYSQVESKVFRALLICLGHKFPKIRKITAEKMYTRLLLHDDVLQDEQQYDSLVEILSETAWDASLNQVRPAREKLFDLLNIEKPVKKTKACVQEGPKTFLKADDDSYKTLVKEMGY